MEKRRIADGRERVHRTSSSLQQAGFLAEPKVVVGNPAEEILKSAQVSGFGLVVMGSRGRGAVGRALMGSVSDEVRRHSTATLHSSPTVVSQCLSWLARKRGRRSLGVGHSAMATAVASASAWLGGHLSFGQGVGVNQTAFESLPQDWTPVIDENDLEEGSLNHASVDGAMITIVKAHEGIYAILEPMLAQGLFPSRRTVRGKNYHFVLATAARSDWTARWSRDRPLSRSPRLMCALRRVV